MPGLHRRNRRLDQISSRRAGSSHETLTLQAQTSGRGWQVCTLFLVPRTPFKSSRDDDQPSPSHPGRRLPRALRPGMERGGAAAPAAGREPTRRRRRRGDPDPDRAGAVQGGAGHPAAAGPGRRGRGERALPHRLGSDRSIAAARSFRRRTRSAAWTRPSPRYALC